jgi:hypothetical protein
LKRSRQAESDVKVFDELFGEVPELDQCPVRIIVRIKLGESAQGRKLGLMLANKLEVDRFHRQPLPRNSHQWGMANQFDG